MAPIIKVENIHRKFLSGSEPVYALNNVTFSVEAGSLTILRGRSGSGKTTLLNIIGALDKPNSGQIFFNNDDITNMSIPQMDKIRRNEMGFVFQSIALISFMSAYENVEFGLRVAGYNSKDRKKRAIECLKTTGMEKRMNHRPGELSGGEQQRVAIARAIAHRPKVIFADEPTAQLDTHMGLQIMKVFKDIIISEGVTVIMTTHDPNMVDLADEVITLEDGQVIENLSRGCNNDRV
jgi:ABC-type antimicrobial peptide transport system, ATPase component